MYSLDLWPKSPPPLSADQQQAREKFMMLWHQRLPSKYAAIEKFNHGWVARLPVKQGSQTLEVGAGIGGHLKFEDLGRQAYYCLEYRPEFCESLARIMPPERVICGSIECKQPWPDQKFDRIIAIHVLEHLCNLPKALDEIRRLMKDDAVFDVALPCEGGLAYALARKVSAEPFFERTFGMDYTPIVKNEHVNTFAEIQWLIDRHFLTEKSGFFPLQVPVPAVNLVVGLRLRKKK